MTRGLTRQRPGELPVEVTGFIGRQRELAELSGLLTRDKLGQAGFDTLHRRGATAGEGEIAELVNRLKSGLPAGGRR